MKRLFLGILLMTLTLPVIAQDISIYGYNSYNYYRFSPDIKIFFYLDDSEVIIANPIPTTYTIIGYKERYDSRVGNYTYFKLESSKYGRSIYLYLYRDRVIIKGVISETYYY